MNHGEGSPLMLSALCIVGAGVAAESNKRKLLIPAHVVQRFKH